MQQLRTLCVYTIVFVGHSRTAFLIQAIQYRRYKCCTVQSHIVLLQIQWADITRIGPIQVVLEQHMTYEVPIWADTNLYWTDTNLYWNDTSCVLIQYKLYWSNMSCIRHIFV